MAPEAHRRIPGLPVEGEVGGAERSFPPPRAPARPQRGVLPAGRQLAHTRPAVLGPGWSSRSRRPAEALLLPSDRRTAFWWVPLTLHFCCCCLLRGLDVNLVEPRK